MKKGKIKFQVPLDDRQLRAVGHMVVQWGHCEHTLNFQIGMWRNHPFVPSEVRKEPVPQPFILRMKMLRVLAKHVLRDRKREFQDEFVEIIDKAICYHDRRDWFAHGLFSLTGNENPERISISVNTKGQHRKERMTTEKLEKLADDIGILTGDLMGFGQRAYEDVFAAQQALLEKLTQQGEKS